MEKVSAIAAVINAMTDRLTPRRARAAAPYLAGAVAAALALHCVTGEPFSLLFAFLIADEAAIASSVSDDP